MARRRDATLGGMSSATARTPSTRRIWPRSVRRAVLTVHVIASVGLLGELSGFLAVAVRAQTTDSPAVASDSYELLEMFSVTFGIPLSMLALATGIALGVGTKWGVFRSTWVTAKLVLLLSVIVVGALVIGPTTAELRDGADAGGGLIVVAAAYDVLALTLATGLSVYKPGGRRRRAT
jgi:Predicted integral membrane protein (DUF2269)